MKGVLIACLEALSFVSQGPGDVISRFDVEGRPTAVVSQPRKGVYGFYVYTDANVYFQPVKQEYYTRVPFEMKLEERDGLRCVYSPVDLPESRPKVECVIYGNESSYKKWSPKPLARPYNEEQPLRSAIAFRISDSVGRLKAARAKYEKDLVQHQADLQKKTVYNDLANALGWQRMAPSPPQKFDVNRAYKTCSAIEDENIQSQLRTATKLVDAIPE